MLFESFAQVIDDDRISEIVIVDDYSEYLTYEEIVIKFEHNPKVKVFRNERNLDCYRNKREAVSRAMNEWVILLDSDNVITPDYLDALPTYWLDAYASKTIFQPSFAMPHFDFRRAEGKSIIKANVNAFLSDGPYFETMLNAMNFVVNRDEYLRVWDGLVDPVTSDSLYFNYKWLEAGNSIYVVPGMHYQHRVHDGSHYKNNVRRTPKGFHEDIINRLKAMR